MPTKKTISNRSRGKSIRRAVPGSKKATAVQARKTKATNELILIDARIVQLESDLETLRRAKALLTANHTTPADTSTALGKQRTIGKTGRAGGKQTIAEASSIILKDQPQLHLREILKRLTETYRIKTTEKNLSKTLNKWAERGQMFKRVAPNTFALVNSGKQAAS